jgi:hypothetical protein
MAMKPLRLVGYICPETGRDYVFLTNIEHLAAQTIADLYKARWQVELFFKWLKQNLKLKGFLGTSKNAVLTQIWPALCVSLLLAYLKFVSRLDLSMQQIARLLQLNLFLRRNLLALFKNEPPPLRSPPAQWTASPMIRLTDPLWDSSGSHSKIISPATIRSVHSPGSRRRSNPNAAVTLSLVPCKNLSKFHVSTRGGST